MTATPSGRPRAGAAGSTVGTGRPGMRALIAGAGKIGRYVAVDLAERGHGITLVEWSEEALEKVHGEGVERLLGDACDPDVLERGGARDADILIAATGDDEDNLVISLLAKQEFAVPRVLARVNYPSNEWLFDEAWGVDLAVSPPHLLTALVEEEVTVGDLVPLLKLGHGQIDLFECRLDERSAAVDQRVDDLDLPAGCTLIAVLREGHVVPVRPTTPLAAGDELLALVRPNRQSQLRERLLGDG